MTLLPNIRTNEFSLFLFCLELKWPSTEGTGEKAEQMSERPFAVTLSWEYL